MKRAITLILATLTPAASALVATSAHAQGAAPATAAAAPSAGDVTPPTVITHVDAQYPPSARAARTHGDVMLALTVDADGHVSKVDVLESGGAALDEAAVIAARQWTFVPAKRNGAPLASRIRVPFHFAPPAAPPEIVGPSPAAGGEPVLPAHGAVSDPGAPAAAGPAAAPAEVRVTGRPTPPSRGVSDFRIRRTTLTAAPHGSGADLLATAPGVYIAHPEGDAVAQRIYLRGFDAEHGQDVELRVAGIPMNQPSHIHGQGYADLNLVIPETVRSIRVIEGVYDPRQGDFAVAGSAEYDLGVEERRSRVKLSYGSFGTKRMVAVWAPEGQAEETFGAATYRQTDGFGNGTRGGISGGAVGQYRLALPFDASAVLHIGAYAARSNIAGVVRRDDVEAGRVGLYDAYADPSARAQSAGTSRTQIGLTLDRRASEDGSRTSAAMWLYLASFRSRINFTGYTQRSRIEPTWVGRGDLIEQSNDDLGVGGSFSYRSARLEPIAHVHAQYELGSDVRTHRIDQAQNLLQAPQNETWDQRDDAAIKTTDIGVFGDVQLALSRYVRLKGGARADLLFFDVDDKLGNFIPAFQKKNHVVGFRRTASGIAFGPRATLEGHPTKWLRLSASYGEGYRSPQARQLEEGEQAPFAKVKSYEVGATVREGERVSVSAVAYQTNLSYDLAFDPGEGRLARIGPTTRRGLVGYLLASPADWANVSVSATYVHATLDSPPIPTPENPSPAYVSGQSLPYVPPLLLRSDVAFTRPLGRAFGKPLTWKAGYGTTFLSSRPLPYGQTSPPVFLLDATVGVRRDWLELSIDAFNLLDARYADTEYAFVSNWQSSAVPSRVPARHITAGAPRALLASVTLYL
jgi:iron complex outermembrane recepter protein